MRWLSEHQDHPGECREGLGWIPPQVVMELTLSLREGYSWLFTLGWVKGGVKGVTPISWHEGRGPLPLPNMGVFQGPRYSSGFQSWQESMSLGPEQSPFPPPFFLLIRPQYWSWTLPRKEGKEVSIYQLQTTDLPQLLFQWQAEQNQLPRESGLTKQAGRIWVDWRRGPLSSLALLPWVRVLLALPLNYGATIW